MMARQRRDRVSSQLLMRDRPSRVEKLWRMRRRWWSSGWSGRGSHLPDRDIRLLLMM